MSEIQARQEQEKVEEEERELMRILKEKQVNYKSDVHQMLLFQVQEKKLREEERARLQAKKEEEERQKEENRKYSNHLQPLVDILM